MLENTRDTNEIDQAEGCTKSFVRRLSPIAKLISFAVDISQCRHDIALLENGIFGLYLF